jgi:hypothetical protein
MSDVNYGAAVVAAIAAFAAAFVYYVVFGRQLAALGSSAGDGRPQPTKMLLELVKTLVLAVVVAGLSARTGTTDWTGALLLAIALWVGFPVVLLVGSVMWENVGWRLAALHAGDWLVKLLVITVIVAVWS